jgi:hypothetical protein
MTFSKEFIDQMSRRMQRHIDLQFYHAQVSAPFNGAKLPPLNESVSTREREHSHGPVCVLPFHVLACCCT